MIVMSFVVVLVLIDCLFWLCVVVYIVNISYVFYVVYGMLMVMWFFMGDMVVRYFKCLLLIVFVFVIVYVLIFIFEVWMIIVGWWFVDWMWGCFFVFVVGYVVL